MNLLHTKQGYSWAKHLVRAEHGSCTAAVLLLSLMSRSPSHTPTHLSSSACIVRQRQSSGLDAETAAPNDLKQRVPSGPDPTSAPSVPAPVSLPLDDLVANSPSAAATDATTTRELNFDVTFSATFTKNQVPRSSPTRSTDRRRRLRCRRSLRSGSKRLQVRALPEATTPLCFAA